MSALMLGGVLFTTACSSRPLEPRNPSDHPASPNDEDDGSTQPPFSFPDELPLPAEPVSNEPVVKSASKLPPISGGTLMVAADGHMAVAADPDRDKIFVVDLATSKVTHTIALRDGDEPGRAAEDKAGRVHVVLRGAGALVSVDPQIGGGELQRREVCSAPRGIAYDASTDHLFLACAGGEVLKLPAAGGVAASAWQLEPDLRDVAISGGKLLVSRFRSAEVLVLNKTTGALIEKQSPPGSRGANRPMPPLTGSTTGESMRAATPSVAWRLQPLPQGGAMMVHQESGNGELGLKEGGYGGGACKGGPVAVAVSEFPMDTPPRTSGQFMFRNLPVDLAVSRDGNEIAFIDAGQKAASAPRTGAVTWMRRDGAMNPIDCVFETPIPPKAPASGSGGSGGTSDPDAGAPVDPAPEPVDFRQPEGEVVAVAFDGRGRVIVQTREPATLQIVSHGGAKIVLSKESRKDTGHDIFHKAVGAGIACASCHPEGGDDGHVWSFETLGKRRSQNLRGGIMHTAPFHWDGDMNDLNHLMKEVFSGRMGGETLSTDQVAALGGWIDGLPSTKGRKNTNVEAVARGKSLYNSTKLACGTCHGGTDLTNNTSVDVGTGRTVQVPSLKGIAARPPFMHDGCAKTLRERFTNAKCGGGDAHGTTSHLLPSQLDDLISYIETL